MAADDALGGGIGAAVPETGAAAPAAGVPKTAKVAAVLRSLGRTSCCAVVDVIVEEVADVVDAPVDVVNVATDVVEVAAAAPALDLSAATCALRESTIIRAARNSSCKLS